MTERPDLSAKLDAATFRSYYYLKEELVSFCRRTACPPLAARKRLRKESPVTLIREE